MSPLGSVGALNVYGPSRPDAPLPLPAPIGAGFAGTTAGTDFGQVLDGLVGAVAEQQQAANAATRQVLLGETDQLHQSVIAMQEASVAFSMMVEVRNKLVESYQELMRMQV